MKRYVIIAVATVLAATGTGISADRPQPAKRPDYQAMAKKQVWEWQDDRASLMHSLETYQGFYEAHVVRSPYTNGVKVQIKDGGWVDFSFRAHRRTVFVGCGDLIYFAEYRTSTSGCMIRAYDLRQCRYIWEIRLKGLGPIKHSKYRNRVRMELFEHVLMVWGNESAGRYVEIIDRKTGKTVGHKVFAKDAASAALNTSPRPEALHDVLYGSMKTYKQWSYQVVIGRAHSRSRRSYGVLKYKGKEVNTNTGVRIWTPWGEMGLTGTGRGWQPAYMMTVCKGKEIESPDPATSLRVKKRWQSIRKGIDTLTLTVEFHPDGTTFPYATLHVPPLKTQNHGVRPSRRNWLIARLGPNSAKYLLSSLTYQGFLTRASEAGPGKHPAKEPCCVLRLTWKDGKTTHTLTENIGWGLPVYERLCMLRANLRDTETVPLDAVLAICRTHLKAWRLKERLKTMDQAKTEKNKK